MVHSAYGPEILATILIVDDDPDIRDCLAFLLEDEGYRVVQARDGARALEIAARDVPGLILSDISMPVLDGYGLLAAVRRDRALAGIPVLLMTAMGGGVLPDLEVQVIGKPFDNDHVVAAIRATLAACDRSPSAQSPSTTGMVLSQREGATHPVRLIAAPLPASGADGVV